MPGIKTCHPPRHQASPGGHVPASSIPKFHKSFGETHPSSCSKRATCLPSLPAPPKTSPDLPLVPQLLPLRHKAARGRRIKRDGIDPREAGRRLGLSSPRGLCPCRSLLLQQQIANGPCLGAGMVLAFPSEAALQRFLPAAAERPRVPFSSHRGNRCLGAPRSTNLGTLNIQ